MKKRFFNQENAIESLSIIMIVLLGLQFALGMYTNLFVVFPSGVLGWIIVHNTFVVSLHLYIATPLTLGSIAILVVSIKLKKMPCVVFSVLSIIGISFAALNGINFSGKQMDIYSYLMAIGFIFSLLSYALGIYYSKIVLSKKIL